jgi:hypothetical protein
MCRDFRARWVTLQRLPKDAFRELEEKFYELRDVDGGGFEHAIERYAKAAAATDSQSRPQAD